MKKLIAITVLLTACAVSAHAQTIFSNNFNGETAGTVPTGLQQDFSTATVTASNGVGGTNGFGFSSGTSPVMVSTTSTYDVTSLGEVTFSAFFEYNGTTTTGGGFSMGWSDSSVGSNYFNANGSDRVLIGVTNLGSGNFGLGFGGQLNVFGNEFDPTTFTLTSGNWYQFVGTLEYTGLDGVSGNSLWDYSIGLTDYGADGTVAGSVVASITDSFEATDFGSTLTLTAARAAIATNQSRGTNLIDNVNISAIPEPSAFAALAGLGVLGLAATRRRRP